MDKPWLFKLDSNLDGVFTISDVLDWAGQIYFLPGDTLFYWLVTYLYPVAQFLEISHSSYHGILSGVISLFVWVYTLLILGMLLVWVQGEVEIISGKSINKWGFAIGDVAAVLVMAVFVVVGLIFLGWAVLSNEDRGANIIVAIFFLIIGIIGVQIGFRGIQRSRQLCKIKDSYEE